MVALLPPSASSVASAPPRAPRGAIPREAAYISRTVTSPPRPRAIGAGLILAAFCRLNRRAAPLALALPLMLSCELPTDPAIPTGAVPLSAPARYKLWWEMTEACSGFRGDFSSVRWSVVPKAHSITVSGEAYDGYWFHNANRIVLAGGSYLDGALVRHEMLHALSGGGHPRVLYLERCNDIVACEGECEAEGGGRPAPSAIATTVYPRDVETRVQLMPAVPSASVDSGALAAIVSVTNPYPYAVWVQLTPMFRNRETSATFGVLFDSGDPTRPFTTGYTYTDVSRFALMAHETRRFVWDEVFGAGVFGMRGFFNVDTTERVTVVVGR